MKKLISCALAGVLAVTTAVCAYAEKTVLAGDVNCDGKVTASDARLVLRYYTGLETSVPAFAEYGAETAIRMADVSADGKISAADARDILRYAADITDGFAAGTELKIGEPEDETTARNREGLREAIAIIESRSFMIKGSMTDNGKTTPLEFAICEDAACMGTSVNGIALKILVSGKKTYFVSDKNRNYLYMSPVVQNLLGLNTSELTNMFDSFGSNMGSLDADSAVPVRVTENGTEYDVFAFSENGSATTEFCLSDGKLVRMSTVSNGEVGSVLVIDELRGGITKKDVSIPDGYKSAGYIEFLSGLMGEMQ